MRPLETKRIERLNAIIQEAMELTSSRLLMARAASEKEPRSTIDEVYDSIWVLACRCSRALRYRSRKAARMRKRLQEPKAFAQTVLEQVERKPLEATVDPAGFHDTITGGTPAHKAVLRPKRKTKREQVKTGFVDATDVELTIKLMTEKLDTLQSESAKQPIRERIAELHALHQQYLSAEATS